MNIKSSSKPFYSLLILLLLIIHILLLLLPSSTRMRLVKNHPSLPRTLNSISIDFFPICKRHSTTTLPFKTYLLGQILRGLLVQGFEEFGKVGGGLSRDIGMKSGSFGLSGTGRFGRSSRCGRGGSLTRRTENPTTTAFLGRR